MCTFEKLSKITPFLLFYLFIFLTCKANIFLDISLHDKLCWAVPVLLQSFLPTDHVPHPQLAQTPSSPRYPVQQGVCSALPCLLSQTPARMQRCSWFQCECCCSYCLFMHLHSPTPPTSFEFEYYFQRAKLSSFFPTKTFRVNFVIKYYCSFLSDTVSKAHRPLCRLLEYFLKGDFKRLAKIQVQVSLSQDS